MAITTASHFQLATAKPERQLIGPAGIDLINQQDQNDHLK